MFIPYYIFLIIYLVVMIVYAIFAFFYAYHIIKFGLFDYMAKIMLFIFVGYTLVILLAAGGLLSHVDWQDGIQLFEYFDLELNVT